MIQYASVEQVAWESRIDSSSTEREVFRNNASLDRGDWLSRIRWDDEDSSDGEVEYRRKRVRQIEAFVEPRVRAVKSRTQRTIPRASHSVPAQLHRFVNCDPTLREQLFFHRPRLSKGLLGDVTWKLVGESGAAGWNSAAGRRQQQRKSGVPTQSTELRASEGDLLVIELSEELPTLVANAGMASTLITINRARNDDDDDPRDSRRGLELELGQNEVSPVVGAFEHGDHALCSDLFRAPLFFHRPENLFLLVLKPRPRQQKKDESSSPPVVEWTIRDFPIDRFAVMGQVEPRMPVTGPGKDKYKAIQEPLAAFAVSRTLGKAAASKAADLRSLCSLNSDELREALFKNIKIPLAVARRAMQAARGDHGALVAKQHQQSHLAQSSNSHAITNGEDTKLTVVRFPTPPPPAAATTTTSTGYADADDLATRFSPEDVCCYESANAFVARLSALGLRHPPSSLKDEVGAHQAVVAMYHRYTAAKERAERLRAKLASFATIADASFERTVVATAEMRAKRLDRELRVARRIHEELVFSPFNLTEGFVDAHVKDVQKIVLKLTGLGDPSGRGDAFNFQRKRAKGASRTYDSYLRRLRQVAEKQKLSLSPERELEESDREDDDGIDDLLKTAPRRNLKSNAPAVAVQQEAALAPAAPAAAADGDESSDSLSDLERELEADNEGGQSQRHGASSTMNDASEARELAKLREERAAADRAREEQRRLETGGARRNANVDRPRFCVRRVRRVIENGHERVVVDFDTSKQEVDRVAAATGFVIPPLIAAQQTQSDDALEDFDDAFGQDEEGDIEILLRDFDFDTQGGAPPLTSGDAATPAVPSPVRQQPSRPPAPSPVAPTLPTNPAGGLGIGKSKLKVKVSRPTDEDDAEGRPIKKKPKARAAAPAAPSTKLKFSTMVRKADEHKAKEKLKKNERHRQEAQAYLWRGNPKPSTNDHRGARSAGSNARDRQAHYRMGKLLNEKVLTPLFYVAGSIPFHKPVPKSYPGYKDKIKQPIDLSTIRDRLQRSTYRKREDFLDALRLMASNAETFNGLESVLAKTARAIVDQAVAACEAISDELDVLEKEIQEMAARSATKRRAAPKAKARKSGGTAVEDKKPPASLQAVEHVDEGRATPPPTSNNNDDASSSSGEEEVLEEEILEGIVVVDDDDEHQLSI